MELLKCPHPDCSKAGPRFIDANSLSYHFGRKHHIKYSDWLCEKVLKEEYSGKWPLCKCGCGEKVPFQKLKFSEYCKGHHHKGKKFGQQARQNMSEGTKEWQKTRSSEEKSRVAKIASSAKRNKPVKAKLEKLNDCACGCGQKCKNLFVKGHHNKFYKNSLVIGSLIDNGFNEYDLENVLEVTKKAIVNKIKNDKEVKLKKCDYCDQIIFDSVRSIGSHNGYWHKEICKNLYHQKKEIEVKTFCEECKDFVLSKNHLNDFWDHVENEHKMSSLEYELKWKYNNIWPLCECGCGKEVRWHNKARTFSRFISGHNKGTLGLVDELSPLYGIPKSEEHCKKISTTRAEGLASGRIQMNTGKRGKPCDIENPFFNNQIEHFDSSWEARFFIWCIENNIKTTRNHNVYIPYMKVEDSKDKFANYIPDFFMIDSNSFVEIKGGYFCNSEDYENYKRKVEAMKKYCIEHNLHYFIFFDDELHSIGASSYLVRKKVAQIYSIQKPQIESELS